jgi:hypothetical protein
VEEFQKPIGYDTAAAGGTFLRVGVGVLRKPDDTNYASFKPYENVDSGKWTVNQKADSAEFAHELNHSSSRYGYVYSKTIRLTPGKPEMVMSHRVAFPIQRFGAEARDYDFRIENAKAGAEMRITGDRPLSSAALWSIRSVLAIEPFLDVVAEPRKDFTWSYTYTYYTLPKANAP